MTSQEKEMRPTRNQATRLQVNSSSANVACAAHSGHTQTRHRPTPESSNERPKERGYRQAFCVQLHRIRTINIKSCPFRAIEQAQAYSAQCTSAEKWSGDARQQEWPRHCIPGTFADKVSAGRGPMTTRLTIIRLYPRDTAPYRHV